MACNRPAAQPDGVVASSIFQIVLHHCAEGALGPLENQAMFHGRIEYVSSYFS